MFCGDYSSEEKAVEMNVRMDTFANELLKSFEELIPEEIDERATMELDGFVIETYNEKMAYNAAIQEMKKRLVDFKKL